jgi:hypothetical protein
MLAARAALERFYHWAHAVEVAELTRLARTVRAWEGEILAFHAITGGSNGPTEAINLLIKGQAGRARLPQRHQLPAAAAAALRRQLADSPARTAARPLPTLGGVEALWDQHAVRLAPSSTASRTVHRRW